MRSTIAVTFLALLAVAAPTAWAHHAVVHAQPGATEPVAALVEMATDGYVLDISRQAPQNRVFDIHVLHIQDLVVLAGGTVSQQYAHDGVAVVGSAEAVSCLVPADCGDAGIWLHGLRAGGFPPAVTQTPDQGFYPAQTLQVITPASGAPYLRVTITAAFDPATYQGAALGYVNIEDGQWVRGFYNSAKATLPVDALDSVPELVRVR